MPSFIGDVFAGIRPATIFDAGIKTLNSGVITEIDTLYVPAVGGYRDDLGMLDGVTETNKIVADFAGTYILTITPNLTLVLNPTFPLDLIIQVAQYDEDDTLKYPSLTAPNATLPTSQRTSRTAHVSFPFVMDPGDYLKMTLAAMSQLTQLNSMLGFCVKL